MLIVKIAGYLFHLLGIYLLIQSIIGNSVLRSYYCHSAGECFIVSSNLKKKWFLFWKKLTINQPLFKAITSCLVLFMLNSIARAHFNSNYSYGYCIFVYIGTIGFNFLSALVLNLDDYVKDIQYLFLKLRRKK